eukprot:256094_1
MKFNRMLIILIVTLAVFLPHFYPPFYLTEQGVIMQSNLNKRKMPGSPSGGQNPQKKQKKQAPPTPWWMIPKRAPKPSPTVAANKPRHSRPRDAEEKKDDVIDLTTAPPKPKKTRNRLTAQQKQIKNDAFNNRDRKYVLSGEDPIEIGKFKKIQSSGEDPISHV